MINLGALSAITHQTKEINKNVRAINFIEGVFTGDKAKETGNSVNLHFINIPFPYSDEMNKDGVDRGQYYLNAAMREQWQFILQRALELANESNDKAAKVIEAHTPKLNGVK